MHLKESCSKEKFEYITKRFDGRYKIRYNVTETEDGLLLYNYAIVKVKPDYGFVVDLLIRERYNESQELSIHRQRESKPEEFKDYFDYCESCKVEAKKIFGID